MTLKRHDPTEFSRSSNPVFAVFWLLLAIGSLLVTGPWAGFHGVLFAVVGCLMLLFPPEVRLPRLSWSLAALFVIFASGVFLPAAWFPVPEWRRNLEGLGVQTGPMVVIQSRQAAETLVLFTIMLITGLWLSGHRPSPTALRRWTLAFTLGVAGYAVLARVLQLYPGTSLPGAEGHFGFFPNRNHTGTYLAMGTICGLGCVLQALRDKRFYSLAVALAATGICIWAVAGWSLSRGGIVLVLAGCLVWIPMLGRRYLGKHGIWALALLGIAVTGGFLIADSPVKKRLSDSLQKAGALVPPTLPSPAQAASQDPEAVQNFDFRIPIALDTFGLITDFPWTGVGAGQFYYVFPQYRKRTVVANDADSYHPESDWLWLASETGLPATLLLLALVALAFWKSFTGISVGKDRALRSACLVAALLVPLHGVFDVPAHRITLAWSAVFLYTLSLRQQGTEVALNPPPKFPFRLVATALLAVSAFLIRAEWFAGTQPAQLVAKASLAQAHLLYDKDQALRNSGVQPDQAQDLLEEALQIVSKAEQFAPLDRGLRRYQGFLALHFDDLTALAREAYGIERELDPTWVNAPLEQALSWSNADREETAKLWQEALRRARLLDLRHFSQPSFEAGTLARIRAQASGNPALELLRKNRLGD